MSNCVRGIRPGIRARSQLCMLLCGLRIHMYACVIECGKKKDQRSTQNRSCVCSCAACYMQLCIYIHAYYLVRFPVLQHAYASISARRHQVSTDHQGSDVVRGILRIHMPCLNDGRMQKTPAAMICVCVCMHVCMHTCVYMHACSCVCKYCELCETAMREAVIMCLCTYMHVCIHVCIYVCLQICMHTMPTHTKRHSQKKHTHTNTHTQTDTHTHTHTSAYLVPRQR
jgi:hypothetical protein